MIVHIEDTRNTNKGWLIDITIGLTVVTTPPEPLLSLAKESANNLIRSTLESYVVAVLQFYSVQGAELACLSCGTVFKPAILNRMVRHKSFCKADFPLIPDINNPWSLLHEVLHRLSK